MAMGAVVGATLYLALGGRSTQSPTVTEAQGGRGQPTATEVPAARPAPRAERAFRFQAPNADADDIAEVRFVDAEGQRMDLGRFRGRDVLLNVWATWCGPCREEMPTLDRLQTRLGGADFEVVALSIDRGGLDVVRDFYRELGLGALRIYVDPSGMAAIQLNILGLPSTLLLDRDGRELGRFVGPAEWDSEPVVEAIRERLNEASRRPAGGG
jgi:thiol-disulfide isomerase/thioredoxin